MGLRDSRGVEQGAEQQGVGAGHDGEEPWWGCGSFSFVFFFPNCSFCCPLTLGLQSGMPNPLTITACLRTCFSWVLGRLGYSCLCMHRVSVQYLCCSHRIK